MSRVKMVTEIPKQKSCFYAFNRSIHVCSTFRLILENSKDTQTDKELRNPLKMSLSSSRSQGLQRQGHEQISACRVIYRVRSFLPPTPLSAWLERGRQPGHSLAAYSCCYIKKACSSRGWTRTFLISLQQNSNGLPHGLWLLLPGPLAPHVVDFSGSYWNLACITHRNIKYRKFFAWFP